MPESEKSRELTSREQKRNRILRAAIEVFASKGYFAARMTDVAAAAKVADGTLYLYFEGKDIFPDDYCPSGYAFAINSNHYGFAVHRDGYYMRSKWKVIPDSPEDKTMKIYFDGNFICNNRKAHKAHSNLS